MKVLTSDRRLLQGFVNNLQVGRLENYHLYDGFIPVYKSERTYPYASVRDLVIASVAPLGEDYVSKYRQFVSGGRIDVYENEGKRSGAYCAGVYGVGPYLLLNYNDTLDAVFTFAHEAGHAMHTVLSYESQPFVTSSYTIFVAEVASTINERFLLNRLLETTTDPKERFLLLQHAVDAIRDTFYSQVMFADYELQAHRRVEKGEPITASVLSGIYRQLLTDSTDAERTLALATASPTVMATIPRNSDTRARRGSPAPWA